MKQFRGHGLIFPSEDESKAVGKSTKSVTSFSHYVTCLVIGRGVQNKWQRSLNSQTRFHFLCPLHCGVYMRVYISFHVEPIIVVGWHLFVPWHRGQILYTCHNTYQEYVVQQAQRPPQYTTDIPKYVSQTSSVWRPPVSEDHHWLHVYKHLKRLCTFQQLRKKLFKDLLCLKTSYAQKSSFLYCIPQIASQFLFSI